MGIYDRGYKKIFSRKDNFLKFINTFIKKDWVSYIDADNLELIDKEFVLKDLKSKEADIIYKARIKEQDIYFYVLLEFQSTVDFSMPLRFLVYMTELMKRIYLNADANERDRKSFKMPAIIPIVIFSGGSEWNVVQSFKEYQSSHELFQNNIIDFTYILINLKDLSSEELINNANLISTIFALDKVIDERSVIKLVLTAKRLYSKFTLQEQIELQDWIREVFREKYKDNEQIDELVNSFDVENEERTVYAMEALLDNILERGRNQILMCMKLLRDNRSVEDVAEETELSVDVINAVKENMGL